MQSLRLRMYSTTWILFFFWLTTNNATCEHNVVALLHWTESCSIQLTSPPIQNQWMFWRNCKYRKGKCFHFDYKFQYFRAHWTYNKVFFEKSSWCGINYIICCYMLYCCDYTSIILLVVSFITFYSVSDINILIILSSYIAYYTEII